VQEALEKLTASSGRRMRFTFQIKGELDGMLQRVGIAEDLAGKFPALANDVPARTRLWQVFRDATREWGDQGARLAARYALARAGNIYEFAERLEFFLAHLDREWKALTTAAKAAAKEGKNENAIRAALDLAAAGGRDEAITAKILADAAKADAAATVDKLYGAVLPTAQAHVGIGYIDPALPNEQLGAAVKASRPRFTQESAAAYHQFKHPQIPNAKLLPADFPHGASEEAKYFALCDHVIREGTPTVAPAQLGGRSVTFELEIGDKTYVAFVNVSPKGETNLLSTFEKGKVKVK
jgi:hypothetical protein